MGDHGTHPLASGLQEPGSMLGSDPLVRLTVIRSFAHKSEMATPSHAITRSPALKAQRGHDSLVGGGGCGAPVLGDPLNSGGDISFENAGSSQIGNILSFKEVSLELAAVDFTAHENFLTSVFNFALQLPLEDISQVNHPPCACFSVGMIMRVAFESAWYCLLR